MLSILSLTGATYYTVPLAMCGGLMHFKMQPPTLDELNNEEIPHVHLSSDMLWDPSKYDETLMEQEGTPTYEEQTVYTIPRQ
jgi:hypothetical protein